MPLPGGDRGGYGTVEVHRHQANAGPVQAVVVVAGAELPPGVPPPVVVFHRTGRLRCGKMRENGKSSVRLLVFEHGGGGGSSRLLKRLFCFGIHTSFVYRREKEREE